MGKLFYVSLIAGCLLSGLPSSSARADKKPTQNPVVVQASRLLAPTEMASRIDQRLEEKWKSLVPAPAADDAEFLRRIYLDLAGRIPRVSEVRAFLEDPASDKRNRIVEQLLESPQYINHFTATWSNLLVPSANSQEFTAQAVGFKTWLQDQVRNNAPYDKMVRDLLTAPLAAANPLDGDIDLPARGSAPVGFLLANERRPENLAASTSRIFMGVKLECAQCHDHPFARWSRDQFWEMAAFFTGLEPPQPVSEEKGIKAPAAAAREIKVPGTEKIVRANFLTGKGPDWVEGVEPRAILAQWLTAKDNPYFARTAVNRVWAHFFGIGLIDPVDDEPREENPLRHSELLAELSAQFIAHDYDIQYLIRAITATRAYQRTSAQSDATQADLQAFGRMAVRGLTAEQLFDSIALATGFSETSKPDSRGGELGNLNTPRLDFLNRFASQERATEKQTSILQALALMNGKFVADATSVDRSATLAAVADAPFLSARQKIDTLYLAALGRLPRPDETQKLGAYVSQGGPRGEERLALGDIFWALLNSSEFVLNH